MGIYTAFKEISSFPKNHPWAIDNIITPNEGKSRTITPLHFGQTIEIVLTSGINGDAFINGNKYVIEGKKAFFVAPQQLHAYNYNTGGDFIICFKLDLDLLKKYIDIPNILKNANIDMQHFDNLCDDYETIYNSITLIRSNPPLTVSIHEILRIFLALKVNHLANTNFLQDNEFTQNIIQYTEEHINSRITVEEIAKHFGYNPNYFCMKFKKLSGGITYINYLNTTKISKACYYLQQGESVSSACHKSGFENVSYFIKTFKAKLGVTPYQYVSHNTKNELAEYVI